MIRSNIWFYIKVLRIEIFRLIITTFKFIGTFFGTLASLEAAVRMQLDIKHTRCPPKLQGTICPATSLSVFSRNLFLFFLC